MIKTAVARPTSTPRHGQGQANGPRMEKTDMESSTAQPKTRHYSHPLSTLRIILAGSILLICSSLLSISPIRALIQDQNTLQTPEGKIRLGQVYGEQLDSELLITRIGDDGQLLKVTTTPENVYPQAIEKVLHYIQQINDKAQRNASGSYTPVEFSSAMWNSDIRVRLVTRVRYQSQYHKDLTIVIDNSDRVIKRDQASIKPILDELKDYGRLVKNKYNNGYSFIP